MDEPSRAHAVPAAVMSAFLRVGAPIDHASSLLLALTILLVLGKDGFMIAALVPALTQKYFAWRTALDTHLFDVLGRYPDDSAAFDAALAACLGSKDARPQRALEQRWRGARRLLQWQLAALALQLAMLLAIILR
jgi:hypothetical protein